MLRSARVVAPVLSDSHLPRIHAATALRLRLNCRGFVRSLLLTVLCLQIPQLVGHALVLELLEGGTLHQALLRNPVATPTRAVKADDPDWPRRLRWV